MGDTYQYAYRGYTIRIQRAHPVCGDRWYWQVAACVNGTVEVVQHQLADHFQEAVECAGVTCSALPNRAEQDYPLGFMPRPKTEWSLKQILLDAGLQDCEGAV